MCFIKYLIVYFIFYFYHLSAHENNFNPYETLGVSRTASDRDIRQSYKKLAKHWHPDKNSEPNANEQFTKINAAYEILSNRKKRQDYDQYGTTSEGNHHQGFNPHNFHDPFDMFRSHFFHETSSNARKLIHAYEFLNNILPNSHKKPYVIFGSTNFCFHCRRPAEIFRSMESQFNDVGIGTGEFNIHEQRLSNELGILNVPSLCVISQGRVYHFDDRDYSETNIKQFVRNAIPIHRYIKNLQSYDDITKMLTSYNQSNRVSAILITKQKIPSFKFVLPCLKYSARIECASFSSSVIKSNSLPLYLTSISQTSDTILLFKEDINKPEVVIKNNDFTFDKIQNLFESNQLLHLPIITSINIFDLICPISSTKPCFLILGNRNLFARYHSTFLQLSKQLFHEHKSHLAYLDLTQQIEFKKIFSSNYYHQNLHILAVRRWSTESIEIQDTKIEFHEKSFDVFDIITKLASFFNNRWSNAKKYSLQKIIDFDQRHENIFLKLYDYFQNRWNYWVERNGLIRYLVSYVYTYQFWIITIFVVIYIYYLKNEEPETNPKKSHQIKQIQVHEFNEAFLQRYKNPGVSNSIILLLIADTPEDICVKHFKEQISLIKDSHMVYSILYRQQSNQWLNELSNNIQNKQSSQFIPSTVLALYIRRKFFVSYGPLDDDDDQNRNERCQQSSSKITFSDWIDLLFNGTIREPINVTDWPIKFS